MFTITWLHRRRPIVQLGIPQMGRGFGNSKPLEGLKTYVAVLLNMARVKKELTRELRARIKALFYAGWSYCHIGKDLKCSPSTVKYTLDRHDDDATNSHQNRKGRGRRKNNYQTDE